jgi:hypothetical protein
MGRAAGRCRCLASWPPGCLAIAGTNPAPSAAGPATRGRAPASACSMPAGTSAPRRRPRSLARVSSARRSTSASRRASDPAAKAAASSASSSAWRRRSSSTCGPRGGGGSTRSATPTWPLCLFPALFASPLWGVPTTGANPAPHLLPVALRHLLARLGVARLQLLHRNAPRGGLVLARGAARRRVVGVRSRLAASSTGFRSAGARGHAIRLAPVPARVRHARPPHLHARPPPPHARPPPPACAPTPPACAHAPTCVRARPTYMRARPHLHARLLLAEPLHRARRAGKLPLARRKRGARFAQLQPQLRRLGVLFRVAAGQVLRRGRAGRGAGSGAGGAGGGGRCDSGCSASPARLGVPQRCLWGSPRRRAAPDRHKSDSKRPRSPRSRASAARARAAGPQPRCRCPHRRPPGRPWLWCGSFCSPACDAARSPSVHARGRADGRWSAESGRLRGGRAGNGT